MRQNDTIVRRSGHRTASSCMVSCSLRWDPHKKCGLPVKSPIAWSCRMGSVLPHQENEGSVRDRLPERGKAFGNGEYHNRRHGHRS